MRSIHNLSLDGGSNIPVLAFVFEVFHTISISPVSWSIARPARPSHPRTALFLFHTRWDSCSACPRRPYAGPACPELVPCTHAMEVWQACPATIADPCPAPAVLIGDQPRRFRSTLRAAAVVRTCNYCGSTEHLQRACTLGSSPRREHQFLRCSA